MATRVRMLLVTLAIGASVAAATAASGMSAPSPGMPIGGPTPNTVCGPGECGGTVGCYNAQQSIDGTTVTAHWCWNAALNLTDVSIGISQSNCFNLCEYVKSGTAVQTQSGGLGQRTFSETFTSQWFSGTQVDPYLYMHYWVHVVGGSNTLDYVETSWNG